MEKALPWIILAGLVIYVVATRTKATTAKSTAGKIGDDLTKLVEDAGL